MPDTSPPRTKWRIRSTPDAGASGPNRTKDPQQVHEESRKGPHTTQRVQRDWPTAKSMKFKSSMNRKGRGYATGKEHAEWSKCKLERSGYKNPKATINIRSERSDSVNDDTEESGRNECRRKSTYIEADDQRESQ